MAFALASASALSAASRACASVVRAVCLLVISWSIIPPYATSAVVLSLTSVDTKPSKRVISLPLSVISCAKPTLFA